MDLQIDDLIDITIKGARVMYTVVDHGHAERLTVLSVGGTKYVLVADASNVTISKVAVDDVAETTTVPAQTRVSDERAQEILDHLNGLVNRDLDGGTHIVNGAAVLCNHVVGCDANLEQAIAWAETHPAVEMACGPLFGEATVYLVGGTVLEWEPASEKWAVTVSDDTESEVSQ